MARGSMTGVLSSAYWYSTSLAGEISLGLSMMRVGASCGGSMISLSSSSPSSSKSLTDGFLNSGCLGMTTGAGLGFTTRGVGTTSTGTYSSSGSGGCSLISSNTSASASWVSMGCAGALWSMSMAPSSCGCSRLSTSKRGKRFFGAS